MTNSRNKGASFEREIANLLNETFDLKKPLKRILEQTREKYLPDLILGDWYIKDTDKALNHQKNGGLRFWNHLNQKEFQHLFISLIENQ